MDSFVHDKIRITISKLKEFSEKVIPGAEKVMFKESGYKRGDNLPCVDDTWKELDKTSCIGGKDCHYWFYTEFDTPKIKKNNQVVIEMYTGREPNWDSNPQGLLYLNGSMFSEFTTDTHRQVTLDADSSYKAHIYFYTGHSNTNQYNISFKIKEINYSVIQLWYDMLVAVEAAECLKPTDYNHIITIKHLEQACNILDLREPYSDEFYLSVEKARKYLKEEYFEKECGLSNATVSYVGHTHIDVAWLWTLEQTREKVQRTFVTMLDYIDRFPEFSFMSSQPQLYEYLKEDAPDVYKRLKKAVSDGRWEVEGAMWLEADCNLTSGESLVRQILHGKKFIMDEFGIDSHILWLPDVFGYSAAMPQILKKSGIDNFVTSKISWNETNKMPYDTFMWQGIDGTEIFTNFLTARFKAKDGENDINTVYAGHIMPSMHIGTWERFQQKEYSNEAIVTYGFGDGGGGPTEDMLERFRRLEYGLPGMPAAKMTKVEDFLQRRFSDFNKNAAIMGRTPKWVGELYLELHRGTYTSVAKNKKNNRECEFLCQSTEIVCVMDLLLNKADYPKKTLDKNWKTLLLNQFHDILPGSSICEVYEESDRQYKTLREEIGAIKSCALENIADKVCQEGILVYNPNSFKASGYAEYKGKSIYVTDVPPLGWKIVRDDSKLDDVSACDGVIESSHYKIEFDQSMNIVSLYDKDNGREVVKEGETFNRLELFEDYPRCYDNWEITNYYKQKKWDIDNVESCVAISGNGWAGFEIKRKIQNSIFVQKIVAYANSRRIDFITHMDWHEHHLLLKAAFPTNILTDKASYEIQFGHVQRPTHENTTWDAARFEVCAHKWADVSEEDYGVSILNNCKYGYSANGGELKLTLLKCGTYPDKDADCEEHDYIYSVYPHSDSIQRGGTICEANLLNKPLQAYTASGNGTLPSEYSLVSCTESNILIDTVKCAVDSDDIIIRLYDSWNRKSNPTLKLGFDAKKIILCDLMENPITELGEGREVSFPVNNFEIITLRIKV